MTDSHPEHEATVGKVSSPVWAVLSWTLVVAGFGVLGMGLLWGEPPFFPVIAFGLFVLAVVSRMRNDRLEHEHRVEA